MPNASIGRFGRASQASSTVWEINDANLALSRAPLLGFETVEERFGGAELAGLALHTGDEQRFVGSPE